MKTLQNAAPFVGPEPDHRWPSEKAREWMARHHWLVGCNYIPSNAINPLEMWQAETFSPEIIDKELGWAAGLGFNTVRVFLHNLLWEQDSNGFLQRINTFLSITSRHGIRTMLVLFDAVWDPFPRLGVQPAPVHNVHNSGWVQCPGYDVLNNPARYQGLRDYVQGIVSCFKDDDRVLIWDLYNEPDNMNLTSYRDDNYIVHKAELSMALLKKTLHWVRELQPAQPLTMAPWQNEWGCPSKITALDHYMFSQSDIISFHCYENRQGTERRIQDLLRYNRPMLCTEYMARPFGSTFQEILPLFETYGIGAYSWGFVAGKSQTHCPWDSWQLRYENEPELWFHDIYRSNGEAYRADETTFLKQLLHQKKERPHLEPV